MFLSCRTFRLCIVTAVLLVSTSAAAAPGFSLTWEVLLEPGFQAALVSQGVLFQDTQTRGRVNGSYYYYDTLVATTADQSLWTLQSSGTIESGGILVYAFSAIPELVFVFFNNLLQPNISAVIPTTGAVVWSTLCPFNVSYVSAIATNLMVSLDGSALHWLTSHSESTNALTALDAEHGTVLWSETVSITDAAQPVQCGSSHSNCLGIFNAYSESPVIQFLDGRTGAVLAEMTLPGNWTQASEIIGLSQMTPDLVLVSGYSEMVVINTTNFMVLSSWSAPDAEVPPQTLIQPMPPGSPTTLAVIEMTVEGIYAVDPFTGSYLWTTAVSALCPCHNPGPGCATEFLQILLPLAPLSGARDLFLFEGYCSYTNGQATDILGLVNLTTGALVKSVVSSTSPNVLVPIGAGHFFAGNAFYDSNLTVFAVYPPTNAPCGYVRALAIEGNTVMFTIMCGNGTTLVVDGTVRR